MKALEDYKHSFTLYARANGGLKAEKLLKILGKSSGFAKAFQNPVGQEVLQDALQVAEEILDKIVDEKATEAEKAEFRALKKIIYRWQMIWAQHNKALEELKKQ